MLGKFFYYFKCCHSNLSLSKDNNFIRNVN
nr:MAG TPA: Protein of unknown function (DUF2650) [Caudoviricetes sp.]